MLHELLLALSGHPSSLFDAASELSPPEAELLASIGHLSRRHRQTREHGAIITASHPSTICRAVAASIASRHLAAFQEHILDVETRILRRDASTVGAYNIVPLATIAAEFSSWVRLMDWLWQMSQFILPPNSQNNHGAKACSGAGLIDRLRTEVQTGYPDIEQAAHHLITVAEAAWLRQLAPWILHGRLPPFGAQDFFIHHDDEDDSTFHMRHDLLPKFVPRHTAASILFIGKSLNQIRSLPAAARAKNGASTKSELHLLPTHVALLSSVTTPVTTSELADAVAQIRLSLSRNLLQYLLPRETIIETLSILHQFFLIGRGEFATVLIAEADASIRTRHNASHSSKHGLPAVGQLTLKEAQVSQTLSRTMSVLSTLSGQDEHLDDVLESAGVLLQLSIHNPHANRPGTPGRAKDADLVTVQPNIMSFYESLLPVPTSLSMIIQPPLDLFITKNDMNVYSLTHSYLLAIRRAHLHLTELWLHSSIRRDHPCPPGYQYSNSLHGKAILKRRRQRLSERARVMRRTWATCRAAIYFLAEVEAHFQGTVIEQSFHHFLTWATGGDESSLIPSGKDGSPSLSPVSHLNQKEGDVTSMQHDPETLAHAHRQFLASVLQGLLINDSVFTKTLRQFCTHVDELVAFVTRLVKIQQNLDLEEDEGIDDVSQNYRMEERDVKLEINRASRRLDSDLKGLVGRLQELDNERAPVGSSLGDADTYQETYSPLRIGGVDRLLIKLDWDAEDAEENEDLL